MYINLVRKITENKAKKNKNALFYLTNILFYNILRPQRVFKIAMSIPTLTECGLWSSFNNLLLLYKIKIANGISWLLVPKRPRFEFYIVTNVHMFIVIQIIRS